VPLSDTAWINVTVGSPGFFKKSNVMRRPFFSNATIDGMAPGAGAGAPTVAGTGATGVGELRIGVGAMPTLGLMSVEGSGSDTGIMPTGAGTPAPGKPDEVIGTAGSGLGVESSSMSEPPDGAPPPVSWW